MARRVDVVGTIDQTEVDLGLFFFLRRSDLQFSFHGPKTNIFGGLRGKKQKRLT